ncbi:hypothetical protein TNIN_217641 [Trichonephila inaurata madagascariensis]|uniref:Uncharacterized protein n=1 Tax=Trichonephila inaurata madagascariensis TaxID=2747483 RepID=A0A8X6WRE5_9ARAC|nr:hypothetical protein TNIN_217641 [Trichonephila inaurata madagascariensis]
MLHKLHCFHSNIIRLTIITRTRCPGMQKNFSIQIPPEAESTTFWYRFGIGRIQRSTLAAWIGFTANTKRDLGVTEDVERSFLDGL